MERPRAQSPENPQDSHTVADHQELFVFVFFFSPAKSFGKNEGKAGLSFRDGNISLSFRHFLLKHVHHVP